MKAYIVFGNEKRSDDGNIKGVFIDEANAKEFAHCYKVVCNDVSKVYALDVDDVDDLNIVGHKKAWKAFRDNKLLWFANSILHLFGWAIIVEMDKGEIIDVYPERVSYRGFPSEVNTEGYIGLSEYLKNNIDSILKEAKE